MALLVNFVCLLVFSLENHLSIIGFIFAGVDIATSGNGYVYHTRFDRTDIIPVESFQNVGDNILALADAIANAPELNNVEVSQHADLQ